MKQALKQSIDVLRQVAPAPVRSLVSQARRRSAPAVDRLTRTMRSIAGLESPPAPLSSRDESGLRYEPTDALAPPPLLAFVDQTLEALRADAKDVAWFDMMRRQDRLRLAASLEWLERPGVAQGRALEVGGRSAVTELISRHFPALQLESTTFDLRHPFPIPDASYDLVISMEVIEHVSDEPYTHGTLLTGVKSCLSECFRVLKPGGRLFLTTPNASSAWTIQAALLHQAPWIFTGHFREFTIGEMKELIEGAGFRIDDAQALQVLHFWGSFRPIVDFMRANGYSVADRGDNTFVLATRPG